MKAENLAEHAAGVPGLRGEEGAACRRHRSADLAYGAGRTYEQLFSLVPYQSAEDAVFKALGVE